MKSSVSLPFMCFFLVFMLLLASEAMVWGARARGLEAMVPYSAPPPKALVSDSAPPPKALESDSPPPPSPVRSPRTKRSPYSPPPPRVEGSPPIIPVHA